MDGSSLPPPVGGVPKKRRFTRVSRACVECRVRKIRCNAAQPCEACEDFNRRCVYSSTKAQRTSGAPRTKILEDRLRRARALISQLQAEHPSVKHRTEIDAIFDTPPGSPDSVTSFQQNDEAPQNEPRDDLENMMDGQGSYTASNQSNPIYYGGQSGFKFLERTQQLFEDDGDSDGSEHGFEQPDHAALSQLFDTPLPARQPRPAGLSTLQSLPPQDAVPRLLDIVFEQTYQLLRFVDVPWFKGRSKRLYDVDADDYTDSDHDFLPLFLGVAAVGYLFDTQSHREDGCMRTVDQAMRHFTAARQLTDVTQCHDLVALQTIMVFALFLISTARLATAHTYIAVAAAAAMRMGLHSQTTYGTFTSRENNLRRRLLWTIVKLDIYTGTILGLPGLVNLSHVDQVRPSASVAEHVQSPGTDSLTMDQRTKTAASAQYRDLLLIVANMVQKLFPKTEEEAKQVRKSKKMLIKSAIITDIERQFKEWRDALPAALGVTEDTEPRLSRSTLYELEMAHNLGLILLYRPFLHYLARIRGNKQPDQRQLRCASACIRVARDTISRSNEILTVGLLSPASWPSVYTTFLSVVALIFYLATQKGESEYTTIEKEAETGIRILVSTRCQAMGASRCLDVLKVLSRRLSHIVNLNIEGIVDQTQPCCQMQFDAGTNTRMREPRDSPQAPSQKSAYSQQIPTASSPTASSTYGKQQGSASFDPRQSDDHTLMTLAGNPRTSVPDPKIPEQPAERHVRQRSQTYSACQQQDSNLMVVDHGIPVNLHNPAMHDTSRTTNRYFEPQADMEVPFSDTFAWPFDPYTNQMNSLTSAAEGLSMPSGYSFDPPSTGAPVYYSSPAAVAGHVAHPQPPIGGPGVPSSIYPTAMNSTPHRHPQSFQQPLQQQHYYSPPLSQNQHGSHFNASHHGLYAGMIPSDMHMALDHLNDNGGAEDAYHTGSHAGSNDISDGFLTGEDIAAFMTRISPGEQPFL